MLLPDEASQIDLLRRSARLLTRVGKQLGSRPLVLPTAEFFPDRFTHDAASTERLLERMQTHAGMLDIPVDVRFVASEGDMATASGCGGGSCATPSLPANNNQRLIPHPEGWLLQLSPAELGHPVALTCTLARSLASIFLIENAGRPEEIEAPFETSVDTTATALGFGVLLLEGSHIYAKSCGGPSIAQVTALNVGELSLLFAIFCHVHGQRPKAALAELSVTQRAAANDALYWAKCQRHLLDQLKNNPQALLNGPCELKQQQSWLSRLINRPPKAEDLFERALRGETGAAELSALAARPRANAAPKKPLDPAKEELRALVKDAFTPGGQ